MWYDRRMNRSQYCKITAAAVVVALATVAGEARAAQCGNSAAGFEGWKQAFAGEARAKGVGASGVSA
jgi:membrane-bound lytic murein transglycosylase B